MCRIDIKACVIEYVSMTKVKEYCYTINRGENSVTYIAKNNKAFMNYFIENINEFRDLLMDIFTDMYSTKSRYMNIFSESFDTVNMYDISINKVWDYCVEDVCDVLRDKTYEEFVMALEGKRNNNQRNDSSHISIRRSSRTRKI